MCTLGTNTRLATWRLRKTVVGDEDAAIVRLANVVKENKITVGQATIGDEKGWNVFIRLGTDAEKVQDLRDKKDNYKGK